MLVAFVIGNAKLKKVYNQMEGDSILKVNTSENMMLFNAE